MGWAAVARQHAERTTTRTTSDWRLPVAAFALAMMTEPAIGAIVRASGAAEPAWARLFWLPVYAAALPLIGSDWRGALRAMRATPLLCAALVLALLSAFWSIAPDVTLRRAFALAVTMALGWRLARFEWRELLRALAWAWSALIVGSFAFALLWPAAGVMDAASSHPGAWSGLWTHKNMLGGMMGVGVTVLIAAALTDRAHRRRWFAFAAGAFALVLLSTSATALLATLAGVGVMGVGAVLRRGGPVVPMLWAVVAFVSILATFVAAVAPDTIFALLGRDSTLTGRTDIWSAALDAVSRRPQFGHGFGAFWSDAQGPAFWLRQTLGWDVPNAHNGWLELLLALGWTGAALLALQFLRTLPRVAIALADPTVGLVAPPFVAMFALMTLSEGYILQDNSTVWVMYVAIAAKLALKPSGKESV